MALSDQVSDEHEEGPDSLHARRVSAYRRRSDEMLEQKINDIDRRVIVLEERGRHTDEAVHRVEKAQMETAAQISLLSKMLQGHITEESKQQARHYKWLLGTFVTGVITFTAIVAPLLYDQLFKSGPRNEHPSAISQSHGTGASSGPVLGSSIQPSR